VCQNDQTDEFDDLCSDVPISEGDDKFGRQIIIVFCIKCNCVLNKEIHGGNVDIVDILYGGVICRTYGNYGSAEFDPQGSEFYEFYLCDNCLRIGRHSGTIDQFNS
jgi:hypothetical protein